MKKKIFAAISVLLLSVMMLLPTFAADGSKVGRRLVDNAGLLSESEKQSLSDELDEISDRQAFDVVIVTTDSLDGKTATEYADDYYDENGYGYNYDRDGVMLLVSMEDRDWAISTCGLGIEAFTDAGQSYISDLFLPELSNGYYAEAFQIFAEQCDSFVTKARQGEPYDSSSLPSESGSYDGSRSWTDALSVVWIPISLAIGFVIALLVVGVMKSSMKTVRRQAAAQDYLKAGSLNLTDSRDVFLYRKVDRIARPKDDDTGGGSTIHTSSSGTRHGGSSGKF